MKHSRGVRVAAGIIVAIPFIAIVLYVVITATSGGAEDREVAEAVESASAPRMTDDEFEHFQQQMIDINPSIVDRGIRAHARDSCSIDAGKEIEATTYRFSNSDHEVTKDEAREILDLIDDIGFCDR